MSRRCCASAFRLAIQRVWNASRADFPRLPRLSFGKAVGVVFLWGLLFLLVLTMISGARELLTPGAWRKEGFTYKLDADGNIIRKIDIGAEISGHVFIDDLIYVLRGTEQNGESWTIARLDPRQETPELEDIAIVPFACRSLTFDGEHFWTNHRAANEIISFALPN